MHKKKIQGKNSQFKREPKDGSCWVTKQKGALVHSALRCVMICFWRMVFMLSGEAFLEQWLMWCPKCHGFHITHKLFSASCQSTSRREELKSLKKGESKFLVEHVQVSAVGFCPQRPHAHVHARTCTQFRQTWILVYTLTEKHTHAKGSLSPLDTHSNTYTRAVKVMAYIFHCATGDPKYLHCLAEPLPEVLGLGELWALITQRKRSTSSCEYVICLHGELTTVFCVCFIVSHRQLHSQLFNSYTVFLCINTSGTR